MSVPVTDRVARPGFTLSLPNLGSDSQVMPLPSLPVSTVAIPDFPYCLKLASPLPPCRLALEEQSYHMLGRANEQVAAFQVHRENRTDLCKDNPGVPW